MAIYPKIVVVCPPQIKSNWGDTPIVDLFEGNNLVLRVNPNSYNRIEEGDKSSFADYFGGVGYQQSPRRVGFQVAITDTRDELAIALMELSKGTIVNSYRDFNAITVYDYCRPETKADYNRGYAIRKGQISLENWTGSRARGTAICATPIIEIPGSGRLNSGFSLKFISANKENLG